MSLARITATVLVNPGKNIVLLFLQTRRVSGSDLILAIIVPLFLQTGSALGFASLRQRGHA